MNSPSLSFDLLQDYYPLFAMWAALILHRFYPVPCSINPLIIWHYFAQALSDKVNHSNDPPAQQRLSGILAFCIMLLGSTLLLWALKQLIWLPELFDFLLLWLALGIKPVVEIIGKIEQALLDDDKATARVILSKYLNRDTLSLSSIGIAKSGCEMLIFSYARCFFAILFWYAIAGATAAYLYVLIAHLTRIWATRIDKYAFFGLMSAYIFALIDWLPNRLFAWYLAIGHRGKITFSTMINRCKSNDVHCQALGFGANWLMISCGTKYQISLGGPIIYNNEKINRERFGQPIAPSSIHLALLNQQLKQKALGWVVIQSILMWLAISFL